MSLEVIDAMKSYGEVHALDRVTVELGSGRVHAILGPSGSGKTTLLHAICGLERLSHGTIRWDGHVFQEDQGAFVSPERRDIGMVFQDFALFPHMTVAENIGFGLQSRQWTRRQADQRIEELLHLLHLAGLGGRYPHELSGGQKQRTAVARALAPGPSLLLLDESLSSLDAALRRTLQHELRDLFKRLDLTAVLVTHDPQEALVMADNIVVMNQGRVISEGDPRSLYERPDNATAAELMGLATLWDGSVVAKHDQGVVVDLFGHAVVVPNGMLDVGTSVTVVIRPSSCAAAGPRESGIDVLVEQVRYLGDYYLVTGRYQGARLHFYLNRPPFERERVKIDAERIWCYPTRTEETNPTTAAAPPRLVHE